MPRIRLKQFNHFTSNDHRGLKPELIRQAKVQEESVSNQRKLQPFDA